MKKVIFLGILCMLLIICGCATVHVTKTGKGYFAPTDPDEVEILMTVPARSFTEIATVTTTKWQTAEAAKMHNSLRAKCAPLGASAVILSASGIDNGGYYWSSGVAIRYKDE
ncbi:hypothetical protein HQ584_07885 [Patescibacteria group bacterium]|nr:hypothetical protein [Patescibacteria group bacterium]